MVFLIVKFCWLIVQDILDNRSILYPSLSAVSAFACFAFLPAALDSDRMRSRDPCRAINCLTLRSSLSTLVIIDLEVDTVDMCHELTF